MPKYKCYKCMQINLCYDIEVTLCLYRFEHYIIVIYKNLLLEIDTIEG